MGLLSLLFKEPRLFLLLIIPLLYSIIIHEVAHGWVALLFGDNTARLSGRLTLDPRPHIDPVGALMVFLVGFGWARPVPVNYYNLKDRRTGLFCVALAGCFANVLIAMIARALLQIPMIYNNDPVMTALLITVRINIMLCAFNLIPIPPLDGSRILMSLLPSDKQQAFARLEPYGFFILIILLFSGVLEPVIDAMQQAVVFAINFIFKGL